ncbi:MAG TPA: class I SAM-dependent methyltransferase [Actinocrinis sp.]|nr:class I SAM-dependent methyltransferase [Actinocrinis sp.]
MAATPTDSTDVLSPGEQYLRAYHDQRPGRQADGVQHARLPDGRTSHEAIADTIAGAERVLDLGCADGALLALLAARGVRTLGGIDLSEQEIALARRRPALANADLRCGRAQELPWEADSFDAVTAHMSLMLMDDVEQVIAATARVLRPGGQLAVTVGGGPVPGGGAELFLQVARDHLRAAPRDRRPPRFGDPRTRDRAGLTELLEASGFELVGWEPIVVERVCTAEELWEEFHGSFYGMEMLDSEQAGRFRADFLQQASRRALPDGTLPGGMTLNTGLAQLAR